MSSSASGNVTGGESSTVGGLAGENHGLIAASTASGNVEGTGLFAMLGGLVGINADAGQIQSSSASGTVTANLIAVAGGLVGKSDRPINASPASGHVIGPATGDVQLTFLGGLVGTNFGTISQSTASGAVTGGTFSFVGGLVGGNSGTITQSTASGAVSGGQGSTVGGFAGWNIDGSIANSTATGTVTGTSGSVLGGFAGLNSGAITASQASGAVTGQGDSTAGGFVGLNLLGTVSESSASGRV